MIVSREIYNLMLSVSESSLSEQRALIPLDAMAIGVDFDSLSSLCSQIYIRNLRKQIRKVNPTLTRSILSRIQQKESMVSLAREYCFGFSKFAKICIEGISGESLANVNLFLKNPKAYICDENIRNELIELIQNDPFSSHEIDQLKDCIGREYEELLVYLLHSKQMCFETEAELRNRGKPKTPDILFLIPMGTYRKEKSDGELVVINWIDSKAIFADSQTFEEHLDQFKAYNNRYGRGMVIYWHGYVNEVEDMVPNDMILISDHFPDTWIFPSGDIACDKKKPSFDKIQLK